MNSLRGKLIAGILTGITLLIAVGGAATYFSIKERLHSEFDRNLVHTTVLLASMIELDAGVIGIEWLGEDLDNPAGQQPGIDYYSVWTSDRDEPLVASPGLEPGTLPRLGGSFEHPELREVMLPGGRPARCAGIELDPLRSLRDEDDDEDDEPPPVAGVPMSIPPEGLKVQLVVAKLDTVTATLAAIRRPLIGLWAGCTIFGGVMIWTIVRRTFRPLDELRAQIRGLEEGASNLRITLERQPAELEPVTRELNRLLERVEKTLLRERTLTSNVAHELRTPIAGLLSTLEVTLHRLRSPEEYRESTAECFEIAKRMNWLVNNLLSITRIEAGNVSLQCQEVRIESALREWWLPFESRAGERGLKMDWRIDPPARIETDPEFFRVVVTNLFDNAVSYAPEGGTIRVEAKSDGTISVANHSVALNAELIERAFDPFWRKTEARNDEIPHVGLGLNLCKRIMEVLGGRISAQIQEPENWFVVRLELI